MVQWYTLTMVSLSNAYIVECQNADEKNCDVIIKKSWIEGKNLYSKLPLLKHHAIINR